MTLPLPDQKGYVELVNEPEVRDRGSTESTSLVAYFLESDARSPLNPPPSDVSFAIDGGGGRDGRARKSAPMVVPLGAEPKPDDPVGSGRFASERGPYQLAGLRGTLNAKIGGQVVSAILAGGR